MRGMSGNDTTVTSQQCHQMLASTTANPRVILRIVFTTYSLCSFTGDDPVYRHLHLRRDADVCMEPCNVLHDGLVGRRHAAHCLYAAGENDAVQAPRLVAGID